MESCTASDQQLEEEYERLKPLILGQDIPTLQCTSVLVTLHMKTYTMVPLPDCK